MHNISSHDLGDSPGRSELSVAISLVGLVVIIDVQASLDRVQRRSQVSGAVRS
jgi:hypothetical protein